MPTQLMTGNGQLCVASRLQVVVSYLSYYYGITSMNLELIGQLLSVAFIVGAGPIIIASVFVRGGNL
jgi:hypothetical protein